MSKNLKSTPKLIIGFLVIGIMIIGGYFLSTQKIKEEIKVSYGHSVKNIAVEAVEEAVSAIKTKIADPDYIILFSTVGYDLEKVLDETNKLLKNTKVYGGTSMLGVLTKDGWHQGDKGSLAMMAISSPKIVFGVGGANLDEYTSAKEAGKAAIQNAIKNAKKENEFPQLVLMTASPGKEEEILSGIEDVIGWGIPIIGGSSADNTIEGHWKQFSNDKIYSNGVSLTAIFTDLKISYAYESGYKKTEKTGIITKADGRIIYEINDRPAAEVYNEWCNGCVAEELETGGQVLLKTNSYPLSKIIESKTGTYYLSMHPLAIENKDKSLAVFANVIDGDRVLLMQADWPLLLNRAKTISQKAMLSNKITKDESIFGIYTYCAGTMLTIPPEERPKMPSLVSEIIGEKVPFIGTFSFGEQGPLGIVNHHGNLINSIILFSEEN